MYATGLHDQPKHHRHPIYKHQPCTSSISVKHKLSIFNHLKCFVSSSEFVQFLNTKKNHIKMVNNFQYLHSSEPFRPLDSVQFILRFWSHSVIYFSAFFIKHISIVVVVVEPSNSYIIEIVACESENNYRVNAKSV